MCGLTGFISSPDNATTLAAHGRAMADALRHRGPDDDGIWTDANAGVCLAHRRLAIVDLSPAGHQPMASAGGRFLIAYNGEIYNHCELRRALEDAGAGLPWRGHSDTETLLRGIEHWGLDATLQRAVGMFAIALWDRQDRVLHLVRDRFGEKPLYYGWVGAAGAAAFVFGSELKAIRAYPGFDNPVCRDALALYMRYLYVPAPYSIHRGIYKLEPGCRLSLAQPVTGAPLTGLRAPAQHGGLTLTRWWSMANMVQHGAANLLPDDGSTLEALEQVLMRSIAQQSMADVPLGAFLSGGVDSSLIVALMQAQATRPVKTFTIGFDDTSYDESRHAEAVAAHLGTEHQTLRISGADALAVVPRLPEMYDEPFADSSQIPTHLVCAAARQHFTVALSGDAGDELFGGYNRYLWGPRLWRLLGAVPYPLRQALSSGLTTVPAKTWDTLADHWNRYGGGDMAHVGEKLHKLGRSLRGVHNADELYLRLISEWHDPGNVLLQHGAARPGLPTAIDDPLPANGLLELASRMMYRDTLGYLPDDILCKVDRAAMAVGLETRVPFLDHRVAELAWQLPFEMKIRSGQGKWALRQVLYKHVPSRLIDRHKAGFAAPIVHWLRGPLRLWAEHLLDERRLAEEGYFCVAPIRRRWLEHVNGVQDHSASLWAVLMFQAWLSNLHSADAKASTPVPVIIN